MFNPANYRVRKVHKVHNITFSDNICYTATYLTVLVVNSIIMILAIIILSAKVTFGCRVCILLPGKASQFLIQDGIGVTVIYHSMW